MDVFRHPRAEPMVNVPPAVAGLMAALTVIHLVREFADRATNIDILLYFAFIPARYNHPGWIHPLPGGAAADVWTFVTYALLHADWTHLVINGVWMLAFGSAVARRFGTVRFFAFAAMTAAAAAAAHLALHYGDPLPLVGASGALSGFMAAAARFAFEEGGPLGSFRNFGNATYAVPAVPLLKAVRNPRVVTFLGAWIAINFLFGLDAIGGEFAGGTIAWEAHLGGFVAGLLGFSLFDPIGRRD